MTAPRKPTDLEALKEMLGTAGFRVRVEEFSNITNLRLGYSTLTFSFTPDGRLMDVAGCREPGATTARGRDGG